MLAPAGAHAAQPRGDEWIIYSAAETSSPSSPVQPADVIARAADGETVNLTAGSSGSDSAGSVSADGSRIAYVMQDPSAPGYTTDVWVMGADGSTRINITNDGTAAAEFGPEFFPDGSWIAFNKHHPSVNGPPVPGATPVEPRAVRADGMQLRLAESLADARDPVVSPDGKTLATTVGDDIWISNLDGSSARNLTGPLFADPSFREGGADFAPDGESLIFHSHPPVNPGQPNRPPSAIYSVRVDGTRLTPLIQSYSIRGRPDYSPDGTRIAFAGTGSAGDWDIWTMNADGTDVENFTNTPSVLEDYPDWGHLALPPPAKVVPEDCASAHATLIGTDAEDALPGTRGPDVVLGLEGNDTLLGGSGKDALCAGAGRLPDADSLTGGGAKDLLDGGPGPDKLVGGPGDDLLIGGRGNDQCLGGAGHDILRSC